MNPEEYKDISVRYDNRVARITLNRPDKLNAIRITTYHELISALTAADGAPDIHVLLLEGNGGQFTAGNDLADLVGSDMSELMQCVQGIFSTVAKLKKVLVVAVEGVAVGIGTTILLHSDLVVASSKTKFRLPFINLGVGPEGGSSVLLPQAIGQKMAREVLLTGRFFTSEEALSWGLINTIAEPGKASAVAEEYIAAILQQPLASVLATKEALRASLPDVSRVVDEELSAFKELLQTAETQKRIASLLKR